LFQQLVLLPLKLLQILDASLNLLALKQLQMALLGHR
jgi:hypothetical protein